MYRVKEIFRTIQGEGYNTGKAALFVRFAGCNLWSGLEKDRDKGPGSCSKWCDTDFVGGTRYELDELVNKIEIEARGITFIVFTGGEPLLQLNQDLTEALHGIGFLLAVETNGTIIPRCELDWICVSPKAGVKLELNWGNELKLIYPQEDLMPEYFDSLKFAYDHHFVQPLDGPNVKENTQKAVEFVQDNPHWRLSLQTHKFINIP